MTVSRPSRLLLALAGALGLAGCLSLGDKPELAVYAPRIAIADDAERPRLDLTLAVAEPSASTLLDSNRIAVRPEPSRLQVYAGAIWSDPAPPLLQSALVDAFGDGRHFLAVVRPTDGVAADLLLRLDLLHFEAQYLEGRRSPSAVVELEATLVDQRARRVLASRRFRALAPAESPRLAAVVPAFEAALGEVAGRMLPWTLEHAARGQAPSTAASIRADE